MELIHFQRRQLSKFFFSLFWKWIYCKRKILALLQANTLPLEKTPFQIGIYVHERCRKSHKLSLLRRMAEHLPSVSSYLNAHANSESQDWPAHLYNLITAFSIRQYCLQYSVFLVENSIDPDRNLFFFFFFLFFFLFFFFVFLFVCFFSFCSTHLSMKFVLLINFKFLTVAFLPA